MAPKADVINFEATLDEAALNKLADAVVALNPQPRERRWVSLSLAIVDAVWSIGANYDKVVVPLVRNKLATTLGVDQPTMPATDPIGDDLLPVTRLTELSVEDLTALTNRQRTSTRNGIRKADAVLRHARMFAEHRVTTMSEAIALFDDMTRFDALDRALRQIPGEGSAGIRRGYLWMVIGRDDMIKPDRMVLRWLSHHDVFVDPGGARRIVEQLIPIVGQKLGRPVSAWEIDHSIWNAGRAMTARRRRPKRGAG
ncbi:hypothetical protein NJB18091_48340 [Mycobacterium marinum]|uniref:hypothetical protein n=1 Tax=Mycobacterium marinum TaxID=1781 RepID=UPI0021C333A9|nr:hypothetical protein [Mycobacterium marinum]GJO06744.1 hypothetical protein NJB18091_48340 [Mycobacterium marinum]